ncbi:hypothetical protein LSH36_1686g00003 [Paralvinella palmiformis]|uniref:Uncharacterized protein n=1 Tax=Paralvinella palmiformis TaxID=53620 RepID=A0AAD9MPQ1_9ANNE|nr:hypothetical protein LSH36_1686g00003 [Paralvinella palmiformis]
MVVVAFLFSMPVTIFDNSSDTLHIFVWRNAAFGSVGHNPLRHRFSFVRCYDAMISPILLDGQPLSTYQRYHRLINLTHVGAVSCYAFSKNGVIWVKFAVGARKNTEKFSRQLIFNRSPGRIYQHGWKCNAGCKGKITSFDYDIVMNGIDPGKTYVVETQLCTREENHSKRQRTSDPPTPSSVCFLCEEKAETSTLRQVMTMQLNESECARTLNDGMLLAKLGAGDAVAMELKYHHAVYNRKRAHHHLFKQQQSCKKPCKELYRIVFSELIIYITDTRAATEGTDPVIFRLAYLATMYKQRLEQLGVDTPDVNSTRLKEQLLSLLQSLKRIRKDAMCL